MNPSQKKKINALLEKYNDVLLHSMRLAIAEDFVNMIITNREDEDFELSELLKNKEKLTNHIVKEFMKNNSSPVLKELKDMDEPKIGRRKR